MADEPKNSLVKVEPGSTIGLKRMLHREKFNPVKQLLRYVYPHLDPKDQAKVCMDLIAYMYPKYGTQPTSKRSQPKIQNNIQVNSQTGQVTLSQEPVEELEEPTDAELLAAVNPTKS